MVGWLVACWCPAHGTSRWMRYGHRARPAGVAPPIRIARRARWATKSRGEVRVADIDIRTSTRSHMLDVCWTLANDSQVTRTVTLRPRVVPWARNGAPLDTPVVLNLPERMVDVPAVAVLRSKRGCMGQVAPRRLMIRATGRRQRITFAGLWHAIATVPALCCGQWRMR
jgi:hypothetical protein